MKTHPLTNRVFLYLALCFFLLMLVFPTVFQLQRGILLFILTAGGFIGAWGNTWRLDRQIVLILLFTVSASLVFMLYGLINGAPGALSVGTVNVLWTILFVFFCGFFQQPETVVKFNKVIIWGVILSALMGIILVCDAFFGLNIGALQLLSFQGAAVGIYNGFTEYRLFNMTTIIYGFPFLLTWVLFSRQQGRSDRTGHLKLAYVALFLTFFAALISGRRAFLLIIMLSPLIVSAFAIISGQYRQVKKVVTIITIVVGLFLVLLLTSLVDISGVVDQFSTVANELKQGARYDQFQVLMAEWSDSPLLGHGAGAAAQGIIRSETMPWAFELSYVALLFHTGIIGVCIYSFAVLWVFISGILIVRQKPSSASTILPLLVGLASFLVVNATNPYLGKFDYLWTIFLPVAAINAYRIRNH